MKKLIYCALALAAGLFAASCQQELLETAGGNTVTFTVQMPTVATKATIGDEASSINDLVYAVYRTTAEDLKTTLTDWEEYTNLVYQLNPSEQVFTDNYSTTVSLELINNQNYVILFWAQNSDVWVTGEDFDLTNITYPADDNNNMVVNRDAADKYAAFSGVKFLSANELVGKKTVELTRPFAQINIAAADPTIYNVVVNSASMTVGAAGDSFNVASQSAAATKESLTYTWENIPATDGFAVGGTTYEHYVAMGYVFANGNVSVSYDINTADHGTVRNTISNVPVEANYRTNIVGKLLTSNVDYEVTLDKAWGDKELAPDALHLAAAIGGEVTLTENVTLTAPLVVNAEMTINLNGNTISGNFHKSVGAIIKNDGILTITGGTISSTGENGGSAVMNNGTMIIEDVTLNGAPNANDSWPGYTVNNTGELTIIDSKITSYHGAVASYGEGAIVTLNDSEIDMNGIPGFTSHGIYTYDNGTVIVNGGTYINKATDQASSGASVINGNVEVNAGNFSGRIENYYGTPVLKGGSYTVKPNANFIYAGYKSIKNGDKWYVVAEGTDAIVSSSDELNTAITAASGDHKIMLLDGEYTIDPGVYNKAGVTIIGAGENVTLDIKDQIYTINGTATIENVKVVFSNNGFKGFQGGVDLNFKECTIEGQPFLYGTKATFEGCTFVQNDPEQYNVWTYAAKNVTFNECVFNCAGRSVLVYHEGNKGCTVTFNNTIFNASTPVEGKAAIEISSSQLADGELTTININGTTKANGFGNGSVSGNPLFNDKNGTKSVIIIDGRTYVAEGVTKDSEGAYYVSTAAGLMHMNKIFSNKTAGKNVVINLDADIDFTGKTWTPVDSHVDFGFYISKINGNGHTISNLTINGQAMFTRFSGIGDVVVKDITFDNAKVNSNGSINTAILTGHTYQNVLLENVDVKNSSITGGYKVAPLIGTVYNEKESAITATLKNCDVEDVTVKATSYDFCTTGMVAFVNAGDNDDIKFENCTVKNVKLYAPNVYTAHAAIYTTGSETLFNEAEGVTVTNVTFENI